MDLPETRYFSQTSPQTSPGLLPGTARDATPPAVTRTMTGTLPPAFAALIALTALCGWIFGAPLLTTWVNGYASMKPTTATLILFMVVALRAADHGRHAIAAFLGYSIAVFASLTLIEGLSGLDPQTLLALGARPDEPAPVFGQWRMSIAAALCFAGLGTAVACASHPRRGAFAGVLAGAVGILTMGGLIELAVAPQQLYHLAVFSSFSLPAGFALFLLAAALLRRHPLDFAALPLLWRTRPGFHYWLLALALAIALPVLAFAAIAAHRVAMGERQDLISEVEQRATVAAQLVESHVRSVRDVAATLAESPLAATDGAGFHAYATRVLAAHRIGRFIALVDPSGVQSVNTAWPRGEILPPAPDPAGRAAVFSGTGPHVGGILVGNHITPAAFAVWAPVIRDGRTVAAVMIMVEAETLTATLRDLRLPDGWLGSLIDRQGLIMARTRAGGLAGQKVTPDLLEAIARAPRGSITGTAKDGSQMTGWFETLPMAGWTVLVGVPVDQLIAPMWLSLRFMLAMGCMSLALAVLLALVVGRHMTRELAGIAHAASTAGESGLSLPGPATVREFATITGALTSAHARINARETALRDSQTSLRAVLDGAIDGILTIDGEGVIQTSNPAACHLFQYQAGELTGQSARLLMTEPDRAVFDRWLRRSGSVHGGGEARGSRREARGQREDGSSFPIELSLSEVQAGSRRLFLCVVRDITERERHDAHIQLLMNEVNHRSKNMLNVVQAVARQTGASAPSGFLERFAARLKALAANQDLLIRNAWQGVETGALARSQLAHFHDLFDTRILFDGPPLRLRPPAAETIGLALHELATNAGKHGALSSTAGVVEISWRLESGRFLLHWIERGGPPVTPPARTGFGTTVLLRMARMGLGARVALDHAPSGVTWHLTCPAGNALETA